MIAKNILVATDFSELGRAAVEHGLALAEKMDAKLNLVCVFAQHDASRAPAQPGSYHTQALHELRAQLAELEARMRPSGRLGNALLHIGEAAPMILLAARELNADLIVLGTHGRRGLRRLLMGSTAEQVLREARVPVMIVKHPTPHAERAPA